jgi:hypothetical protein
MRAIVLIVDPQCEDRDQQAQRAYDEKDFHASSVGRTASATIRESVRPPLWRTTG